MKLFFEPGGRPLPRCRRARRRRAPGCRGRWPRRSHRRPRRSPRSRAARGRSRDDVGNQPRAQLGDLVFEEELALLQAAQLELVLRDVAGEPEDHVVEVAMLHLELVQAARDLRFFLFGKREVGQRCLSVTNYLRPANRISILQAPKGPARTKKPAVMRRNDYDVTDSIRTTDPQAVGSEVFRIYRGLYNGTPVPELERAFPDHAALYGGRHPDYLPCDTEYHDIQHVLDVTLAMARLMDGYQRSRRPGEAELPRSVFVIGTLAALFHDFGYLRRRHDHRHRFGAEYTLTHVSRGAAFLRRYVGELGLASLAPVAGTLV